MKFLRVLMQILLNKSALRRSSGQAWFRLRQGFDGQVDTPAARPECFAKQNVSKDRPALTTSGLKRNFIYRIGITSFIIGGLAGVCSAYNNTSLLKQEQDSSLYELLSQSQQALMFEIPEQARHNPRLQKAIQNLLTKREKVAQALVLYRELFEAFVHHQVFYNPDLARRFYTTCMLLDHVDGDQFKPRDFKPRHIRALHKNAARSARFFSKCLASRKGSLTPQDADFLSKVNQFYILLCGIYKNEHLMFGLSDCMSDYLLHRPWEFIYNHPELVILALAVGGYFTYRYWQEHINNPKNVRERSVIQQTGHRCGIHAMKNWLAVANGRPDLLESHQGEDGFLTFLDQRVIALRHGSADREDARLATSEDLDVQEFANLYTDPEFIHAARGWLGKNNGEALAFPAILGNQGEPRAFVDGERSTFEEHSRADAGSAVAIVNQESRRHWIVVGVQRDKTNGQVERFMYDSASSFSPTKYQDPAVLNALNVLERAVEPMKK